MFQITHTGNGIEVRLDNKCVSPATLAEYVNSLLRDYGVLHAAVCAAKADGLLRWHQLLIALSEMVP